MSTRVAFALSTLALSTLVLSTASAQPRPVGPLQGATTCSVTLYQDSNYQGASQTIRLGSTDMGELTFGNDQVSSLKVSSGCTATLFADASFQGATMSVSSDTPWVGDGWNDIVSSVRVTRNTCSVTIYADAYYQGASQTLQKGSYDLSNLSIGGDMLSSLKVSPGCTATLYEHPAYQGGSRAITSDTEWIGDGWNDIISSIQVR